MCWFIEHVVKPWHPALLGTVVLAVLLHFGLPVAAPGRLADNRFSRSDCAKIAIGMSPRDVQRILGSSGEVLQGIEKSSKDAFQMRWQGDDFEFHVAFDVNHRATSCIVRTLDPWNRADYPCNQ
jgi:hypothetical protein